MVCALVLNAFSFQLSIPLLVDTMCTFIYPIFHGYLGRFLLGTTMNSAAITFY